MCVKVIIKPKVGHFGGTQCSKTLIRINESDKPSSRYTNEAC